MASSTDGVAAAVSTNLAVEDDSLDVEIVSIEMSSATLIADEFVIYDVCVVVRYPSGEEARTQVSKRYSSMHKFHTGLQAMFVVLDF